MDDNKRGVYGKYKIERTDGSSGPGGKHEDCTYFVLDMAHDEHAFAALKAYAKSCRKDFPKLADDLEQIAATRPCGCRSAGECLHFGPQTPDEAMAKKLAQREGLGENHG